MGLNEFIKFGDKLKKLRKSMGLTQSQMAEKLDLKRSTYANYESNKRVPDSNTIEKIADNLDMDIYSLFNIFDEEIASIQSLTDERNNAIFNDLLRIVSLNGIENVKKQLNNLDNTIKNGYIKINSSESEEDILDVAFEQLVLIYCSENNTLLQIISKIASYSSSKNNRIIFFNTENCSEVENILCKIFYSILSKDDYNDKDRNYIKKIIKDFIGIDKFFRILDKSDTLSKELDVLNNTKIEIEFTLYSNWAYSI